MIAWTFIIFLLAAFQLMALFMKFPDFYIYVSVSLILLVDLGMLYRIWTKQRQGEKERLAKELESLKGK